MSRAPKRRKIDPSSTSSSSPTPPPTPFHLDLKQFQSQLASFFLLEDSPSKLFRYHNLPRRGCVGISNWTSGALDQLLKSSQRTHAAMLGCLHNGLREHSERILRYKTTWEVKKSKFARELAAIRKAWTGRELIEAILDSYTRAKLLSFLGQAVPSLSEEVTTRGTMGKLRKKQIVVQIAELFCSGTLPSMRRAEESQVLQEFDLQQMSYVLCGISVPRELVLEVIGFLGYSLETLVTCSRLGVGFYALALSNWSRTIVISKQTLYQISKLALVAARSVVIRIHGRMERENERRSQQLSASEMRYIVGHLGRNRLEELRVECSPSVGRLFKRFVAELVKGASARRRKSSRVPQSGPYSRLRKISSTPGHSCTIPLAQIAPNLEAVEFVSLANCRSLTCLRHVAVSVLPFSARIPKLRSLHVYAVNYIHPWMITSLSLQDLEELRLISRQAKFDVKPSFFSNLPNLSRLFLAGSHWNCQKRNLLHVLPNDLLPLLDRLTHLSFFWGNPNGSLQINDLTCVAQTDEMKAFLLRSPMMEELTIDTNEGSFTIRSRATKCVLRHRLLSRCSEITDWFLQEMKKLALGRLRDFRLKTEVLEFRSISDRSDRSRGNVEYVTKRVTNEFGCPPSCTSSKMWVDFYGEVNQDEIRHFREQFVWIKSPCLWSDDARAAAEMKLS